MPGDYSRYLFDPDKGYSQVLMQQGRVQMDSCWNAMVYLDSYNKAQINQDILGYAAAPDSDAGFMISIAEANSTTSGNSSQNTNPDSNTSNNTNNSAENTCPESNIHRFMISKGRCYIDGLLLHNNADVSFADQPFLPNASDYFPCPNPSDDQQYVVYLDNWQRCITALEDPVIADSALGGADTSTRTQQIWQIKLQALNDKQQPGQQNTTANKPSTFGQHWAPDDVNLPAQQGQMQARVSAGERSDLNNCFYRIEIHKPIINSGSATRTETQYKWSQNNAAIRVLVTDMLEITDDNTANADGYYQAKLTVRLREQDAPYFNPGNLIELSDARLQLQEKAGLLSTIHAVTDNILTVLVSRDQVILWNLLALDNPEYNSDNPQVEYCRNLTRWDGVGSISTHWHSLTSSQGGYEPIQIRFAPSQQQIANARAQTDAATKKAEQDGTAPPPPVTAELTPDSFDQGRYWNFCSRRLSGALDWPMQQQGAQAEPVACPPHGPHHRYACLTRVVFSTDGDINIVENSQYLPQFKPLTCATNTDNTKTDHTGDQTPDPTHTAAIEQSPTQIQAPTPISETPSELPESVQSNIDVLNKQISDSANTIKQLKAQQATDKANIDALKATVKKLNTTVASLTGQITPLSTKVSQLESLAKGQIDALMALKNVLPDSVSDDSDDNKES